MGAIRLMAMLCFQRNETEVVMSTDKTAIEQLLKQYCDQNNESIAKLSDSSPVLLIFLRHMG